MGPLTYCVPAVHCHPQLAPPLLCLQTPHHLSSIPPPPPGTPNRHRHRRWNSKDWSILPVQSLATSKTYFNNIQMMGKLDIRLTSTVTNRQIYSHEPVYSRPPRLPLNEFTCCICRVRHRRPAGGSFACVWKKLYLHYSYLGSVLVVSAVGEGLHL